MNKDRNVTERAHTESLQRARLHGRVDEVDAELLERDDEALYSGRLVSYYARG